MKYLDKQPRNSRSLYYIKARGVRLGVLTHTYNASAWESEVGGLPRVQDYPGPLWKLQDSLAYKTKHQKKKKKKPKKKKKKTTKKQNKNKTKQNQPNNQTNNKDEEEQE